MSTRLTKRVAAQLLKRGESSVKIRPDALKEAEQAITRDDVRKLISTGKILALAKKENLSLYSKVLRKKRMQGRKRGPGKKRGGKKVRSGLQYRQKVRGLRRILFQLKNEKAITNQQFKEFYRLVRGGVFTTKASLLGSIKSKGISITDERFEKLRHM
jgi:large subunit ribosomal protein L19e